MLTKPALSADEVVERIHYLSTHPNFHRAYGAMVLLGIYLRPIAHLLGPQVQIALKRRPSLAERVKAALADEV